jgi:hypothetical protein
MVWHTACAVGLTEPVDILCLSASGNRTVVDVNYTCNSGYFKTSAPTYCQGIDFTGLLLLKLS